MELEHVSVRKRRILLLSSGAALGLACASKWNGVDTLAVVILTGVCLFWFGKGSSNAQHLRCRGSLAAIGLPCLLAALLLVPVVAHSLTFWPLSRSVHRPFGLPELLSMNVFMWRFVLLLSLCCVHDLGSRARSGTSGLAPAALGCAAEPSPRDLGRLRFLFCYPHMAHLSARCCWP